MTVLRSLMTLLVGQIHLKLKMHWNDAKNWAFLTKKKGMNDTRDILQRFKSLHIQFNNF